MLIRLRKLDYDSCGYGGYAPSLVSAIVNTAEVVRAEEVDPSRTRYMGAVVRVYFTDGTSADYAGTPEDLCPGVTE